MVGCLLTLGRANCFTQPASLNTNLFQKHPYKHTRNNGWPDIWASCDPVKVIHKINHHRWKASEVNTKTPPAGYLERFQAVGQVEELRWSPADSMSWGYMPENLGKPRCPEFIEQSARKVRPTQAENPRNLQRDPVKCSSKYISPHMWKDSTNLRPGKEQSQMIRGNSVQHSYRARNSTCSHQLIVHKFMGALVQYSGKSCLRREK